MRRIVIAAKSASCAFVLWLAGCQSIHDNNVRPAAYLPDHALDEASADPIPGCGDLDYKSQHAVECASSKKERDKAIESEKKALQNRAAEIRQDHWSPVPLGH
jgi:hypothetical protein